MKAKIDWAEEGFTHSEPIDAVKCCGNINNQHFLMAFHNLTILISLSGKSDAIQAFGGTAVNRPPIHIDLKGF
jgi:hypothetical protein